jgi:hypothetical protein
MKILGAIDCNTLYGFDGDARVLMLDGSRCAVRDLKRGDVVSASVNSSGWRVGAVIKHLLPTQHGAAGVDVVLVTCSGSSTGYLGEAHFDATVYVTPGVPTSLDNGLTWMDPAASKPLQTVHLDALYQVVLDVDDEVLLRGAWIDVGGVCLATLAHERRAPAALAHPFFGTDVVLQHLAFYDPRGWDAGHVTVSSAARYYRSQDTGLVSALLPGLMPVSTSSATPLAVDFASELDDEERAMTEPAVDVTRDDTKITIPSSLALGNVEDVENSTSSTFRNVPWTEFCRHVAAFISQTPHA